MSYEARDTESEGKRERVCVRHASSSSYDMYPPPRVRGKKRGSMRVAVLAEAAAMRTAYTYMYIYIYVYTHTHTRVTLQLHFTAVTLYVRKAVGAQLCC